LVRALKEFGYFGLPLLLVVVDAEGNDVVDFCGYVKWYG
jgi:hypothetical protein